MARVSLLGARMSGFSAAVDDYWNGVFAGGRALWRGPSLSVSVDPGLDAQGRFRATALHTDAGARVALTPMLAQALALREDAPLDLPGLARALAAAQAPWHGADHLFYLRSERRAELLAEAPAAQVRALTGDDAAAFARFQSQASAQDLDDAYVALDHPAAFGAFEGERLVCAASAYPWDGSSLMDLGVLTLVADRGRGHARAVVRAIARHALAHGGEPQYRCQLDHAASVALAAAAGLSRYGQWDAVPAP